MIKTIDANHLVNLGSLGNGNCGSQGTDYQTVYSSSGTDVCEYHDYSSPSDTMPGDQWNGLRTRINQCGSLNKPIFVGEIGLTAADAGGYQQRAADYDAKFSTQFAAGSVGELPWAWDTTAEDWAIAPNDPTLAIIAKYSILGTALSPILSTGPSLGPSYPTPTLYYCLGTCPTSTPTITIPIISNPPPVSPIITIPVTSAVATPTPAPCATSTVSSKNATTRKRYGRNPRLNGGLLQLLLKWFTELLNLLLRLLSQNPPPTPPTQPAPVTPTPIQSGPTPVPSQPIATPNPCPSAMPTGVPTITVQPSILPTGNITPTP
jgi:hypothetical protein